MLVMKRLTIPHCYDAEYIIYEFAKHNIDLGIYIPREDLDIFIRNCLIVTYFRSVAKVGSNSHIKVVTNSFSDWIDEGSVGDIKINSDIMHKQSQFSLKLVQKGYECTLYKTSVKGNQRGTVQHRCVLCRGPGDTVEEFIKKNPDILKYPVKQIEEGHDKWDFDLSNVKPVFDTRELPKLIRYEGLRAYILKILGGENPCNAEVIPLSF